MEKERTLVHRSVLSTFKTMEKSIYAIVGQIWAMMAVEGKEHANIV